MATAVIMPRQGNSVESCIIAVWTKNTGDMVKKGEVIARAETDKAVIEIESPLAGTLLARFFETGADVPVLTNIAVIGEPGEDTAMFAPSLSGSGHTTVSHTGDISADYAKSRMPSNLPVSDSGRIFISPRARMLADEKGTSLNGITGTGAEGRIIERDIRAALNRMPPMTRLAQSLAAGDTILANGSGMGGRITASDLKQTSRPPDIDDEITVIPVRGVRKITAERMQHSLQTTAQLTLNTSADARALRAYRQRLKASPDSLGLHHITLNDLLLFTVSRILPDYPDLNALFEGDTIKRYKHVHLGFAVESPRGLLVPVIRYANRLSLKQLSAETSRLSEAATSGKLAPDDLTGGTFTVSNLGSFGIDSFTPVLNPPEVAILGIGNINLKPVEVDGEVQFIPHIGLSLTIDHQAVDGAPAARFLQALTQGIAGIDLLLAL